MGKKNKKSEKRDTVELTLNAAKLEHLRDLFSVIISQETNMTLSEHIAKCSKRSREERALWDEIAGLCDKLDVPYGNSVPDLIIATSSPQIGVMVVDPDEKSNSDGTEETEEKAGSRPLFSCEEN